MMDVNKINEWVENANENLNDMSAEEEKKQLEMMCDTVYDWIMGIGNGEYELDTEDYENMCFALKTLKDRINKLYDRWDRSASIAEDYTYMQRCIEDGDYDLLEDYEHPKSWFIN